MAVAARLVKPGGRLVYATCSVLPAENEAIVAAFGEAHRDFRQLPAATVLAQAKVEKVEQLVSGDNLRLWPHRHATDGFFAAVWERG
jgi:16S rRNA (cytosine967-C5)-methyltransferase